MRRVSAREKIGSDYGWICNVRFLDNKGVEVSSYNPNPYGSRSNGREIMLADDEQLVGVYGQYGKKEMDHFFYSFGFIVRKLIVRS